MLGQGMGEATKAALASVACSWSFFRPRPLRTSPRWRRSQFGDESEKTPFASAPYVVSVRTSYRI